jgi:predicted nucleic acid-binding protein
MTLFFLDLNVWLALSVASHAHNADSWNWMNSLPGDAKLVFSRYTQIGLLRLLTNSSFMGEQTISIRPLA